jgi:hypothetical protein
MSQEELYDKIVVGEFVVDTKIPELTQEIKRLREEAKQK